MIRRKVQRLEVVIIGFNLRSFLDRVAKVSEHANDLVHGLDDRMFHADGTTNAGEGDIERSGPNHAWRVINKSGVEADWASIRSKQLSLPLVVLAEGTRKLQRRQSLF